jgi:hypothetical protein
VVLLETIDGEPAAKHAALGEALADAGFVLGARGWMKRPRRRFADEVDDELAHDRP